MSSLGLDVGGANIKLAHSDGYAISHPFPLWKRPQALSENLERVLAQAPLADRIAVTMTGELADCFRTKAEGVEAILAAVCRAARDTEVLVYLVDGRLVSPRDALDEPLMAAASNWHALASFACRYCQDSSALLIDLGSTTCDIIPIESARPCATASTDPERLACGELVYSGIERSPVCALVSELPWQEKTVSIAQELFATTLDAYLVLDDLPEELDNCATADGRPRTKAHARDRLARMICADSSMFSTEDATHAAEIIRAAQLEQLARASQKVVARMAAPPQVIVTGGAGEFLLQQLINLLEYPSRIVSLNEVFGAEISQAACAYALANLAEERNSQ